MYSIKKFVKIWKDKIIFCFFHPLKLLKKIVKKNKEKKRFVEKDLYEKNGDDENQKILIYVNHYFNPQADFPGKSTKQKQETRQKTVQQTIDSLRLIPNADVRICGIENFSLFPIDVDFSYVDNHAYLVYESIEEMFGHVDEYSYFINVEDDILLDPEILKRVIEFDRTQDNIRNCWHPNRLEESNSQIYCPDFIARPGWIGKIKRYQDKALRIAINPHSGIMILSRAKMRFAQEYVNLQRRDIIIGYYMASAYANIHTPFNLFRSKELEEHAVFHLDHWEIR